MANITANLAEIRPRIADAARRSGRSPEEVELLVVSKTWPASILQEAVDAGQTLFGENKVQEACAKIAALPESLRWHFIGHLQRNKVRKVLPLVEAVHSLDSERLATQCETVAGELELHPAVYVEVNLGGEADKHGFTPQTVGPALERIVSMAHLRILGLMCIPPAEENPAEARRWFAMLRELRDSLERQVGLALPGLSMGMSHDYEVAIEEGSTIVRVGSAIFGERTVPT